MRCLVVGGGGFLGSHLVDRMVERGHRVRVLEVLPRAEQDTRPEVEWTIGDFLAPTIAEEATRECDVVFHLASTTIPKTANDNPVFDVTSNVAGSITLLRAAVANNVRRVVFISSGGTVYGIPSAVPIAETHPTQPISAYGIGKLAIEKYLHMFHHIHGMEYCVLRLSNPFGPRQRAEKAQGVVTAFLQSVMNGEEIAIWGDGSVVRDYMYVGDAVDAMARTAESGYCGVVNIGSGKGLSVNEVIAGIEKVTGRAARRSYLAARPFDVPANVLDVSLAREKLGWSPTTTFEAGLERTAAFLASKT